MTLNASRWRTGLELIALALVAWLCHRALVPAGAAVMSADGGVYPITADWIRLGHWTPFQVNYTYGGNTLTFLRAAWVQLFETLKIGAEPRLQGHFTFSHGVVPFLVAASFYALGRALVSRTSAFLMGLLAAVGFHSWVVFNHIEFYNTSLILGCALLAIRGRSTQPFLEFSYRRLFVAALLSGIAFYTYRATMVFIVAAFLPFPWAWRELKEACRARSRLERIVLKAALALALFYLYLEMFGADLGSIMGKRIKVHATPNLKIAIVCVGAVWLGRNWKRINREHIRRLAIAGTAFCVGLLPELTYWIGRGSFPPLTGERNYSFSDSFMVLGRVPGALKVLFSWSDTVAANASLTLLGLAIYALLTNERGQRVYSAVVVSAGLAIFAFIRVFAYDVAPPRYLSPMFPALMLGVGLLLDRWKGRWLYGLAIALLLVHAYDQLGMRSRFIAQEVAHYEQSCGSKAIELARKAELEYVYSDDYGCANQLTVASQWKPFFIPAYHSQWTLPAALEGARKSSRVGVLLAKPLDPSSPQPAISALKSPVLYGEAGGRSLYVEKRP